MITDVSGNPPTDGEDNDNEHINGDGTPSPASRSTSPASGAAQNSTRPVPGHQDLPHQEDQSFSLDSNPASGTTTPTAIPDQPRPRDPRRGARTRTTDVDGGRTEAVNGTELERRKLQIEQLAFEISDVAKARDKILQELAHANMAANEPATEQVNAFQAAASDEIETLQRKEQAEATRLAKLQERLRHLMAQYDEQQGGTGNGASEDGRGLLQPPQGHTSAGASADHSVPVQYPAHAEGSSLVRGPADGRGWNSHNTLAGQQPPLVVAAGAASAAQPHLVNGPQARPGAYLTSARAYSSVGAHPLDVSAHQQQVQLAHRRSHDPGAGAGLYGQPPPGYGQGGYATGNGNGGLYHPQVEGHTPLTAPHTAQSQSAQGARQVLYHGYQRAYPDMGATMPGGGYAQNGGYGQGGQVPYGGPATQQQLHNQFGHLPAHAMHGHAAQVQSRQHSPHAANQSPMMSSPMNSSQGQPMLPMIPSEQSAPQSMAGTAAYAGSIQNMGSQIQPWFGKDCNRMPGAGIEAANVTEAEFGLFPRPYAGLSMRRSVSQVTNTCGIGAPVATSKCHRPIGACDV